MKKLHILLLSTCLCSANVHGSDALHDDLSVLELRQRLDFTIYRQLPFSIKNIRDWQFVQHIDGSGGGTGVHVFFNPVDNKQYTVKDATHQNHLIEELTAKALYKAAGFNAPDFVILDRNSSQWRKDWDEKFPSTPRLIISEFIEAGPKDSGKSKEKIKRWVDVLFGNFDLGGHNYVVDSKEEIYPIDFGGSLRLRACGELKMHEDLWGYFWPKDAGIEPPTPQEIAQFRARIPRIFETLLNLHHQVSIPDFPSLWSILVSRIHSFLNTYDVLPPLLLADRPAIEGKTSAGVLFVMDLDGAPHALLAKRNNNTWSDLGGGSKVSDRTLNRTAWREAIEEMGGYIPLDYGDLVASPYLEYTGEDHYRMYIHKVGSINLDMLKQHVKGKGNFFSVEHEEFQLVPLRILAQLDQLFAPMKALLSQPHAQAILQAAGQGLKWTPEKGSSSFIGRMRIGDYGFDALKLDLIWKNTLHTKTQVARELRTKFSTKTMNTIAPAEQKYSQTRGITKAHLGDAYIEDNDAANLRRLLLEKSSYFMGKPKLVEEKLPFIKRIIACEDQHPNHFTYVHGALGHYGFLWMIATALRDQLYLTEGTSDRSLRLYENVFDGIHSCQKHLEILGEDNDYAPGGQARILSTNMSLIGSLGRPTSETLKYFFDNKSLDTPDEPKQILQKFLEVALQLPQMAVHKFMQELSPYFDSLNNVGALFQLFIPPHLAEQYTYLANPGGPLALS